MLVRSTVRALIPVLIALLLTGCLFALTYYYDNKYIAPPPYGEQGILSFDDADLSHPISLVDGWMLSVDNSKATETFIGQYSNFSYAPGGTSAFGSARYELVLHYDGYESQRALTLLLPEVFGSYTLYVDGSAASAQANGSEIGIIVGDETYLCIEVQNAAHYYSGLVYPPILGTANAIAEVQLVNAFATCVLMLAPLIAAAFAFAIRRHGEGDVLLRHFGVLCVAFAVAGAHGVAWRLGIAGSWWYAIEDAAWMCVLVESVVLAAQVSGMLEVAAPNRMAKVVTRCLWVLPLMSMVWVAVLIPLFPHSIELYGLFQTMSRVLCWVLFAACAAIGVYRRSNEARYILCGCAVLGVALLANILDNNAYEPLYGLWQQEYAGLLLVGVFGWMLVARVRRLRAAQEQVRDLQAQVHAAGESLLHMRRGEEATRVARHDLRHHVGVLKRLADTQEWDGCRAYLDELSDQQDLQPPLRYTDNLVVNAVMAAYLSPAQAAGVRVECEVHIPVLLALRSTELVVLLSNLLSNAAEACTRAQETGSSDVFIAFSMRVQGFQLVVRCENTALPGAEFTKTSKSNPLFHGLGLSAMRQIVESHNGVLMTEVDNGVALVRIVVTLDEDDGSGLRL